MTKQNPTSETDPLPHGIPSVPAALENLQVTPEGNPESEPSPKKSKRPDKAKSLAKKQKKIDKRLRSELNIDEQELKRLKKKLVKAEGFPERGIETWFRLTSRNLYTRRQIVDAKANILVTINALILSVILGTLYQTLSDTPHLTYAVVPLVLANLMSITFAILASKPRLQRGVFSEEDLLEHRVSLMTFDDFYAMPADDYEKALDRVMEDRDLLYGTIKRDIYALGVDLSHRYKHIQRAYGVFLFGIILAAVMFSLCYVMYG